MSYFVPEFTMTAKTAGTADVQVGNVIYHVTVSHKAEDAWMSDGTGHWHECNCGEKLDQAEHTFGEWNETKAPTETETGLKSHSCEVCGYTETVEIPAVPVDPDQPVTPDKPAEPQQPVNPGQPVDPTKPVEPTKPADKDPGHVTPPTGDSTPVFLWSTIAVVCIACIAAMFVYRKKKNHK